MLGLGPAICLVNDYIDVAPGGIPRGEMIKALGECPALVLRAATVTGDGAKNWKPRPARRRGIPGNCCASARSTGGA